MTSGSGIFMRLALELNIFEAENDTVFRSVVFPDPDKPATMYKSGLICLLPRGCGLINEINSGFNCDFANSEKI